MNIKKYEGIFPAFYACYDENGDVSRERAKAMTQYFIDKGVQGLYVGGSSGECIYQNLEERKATLEAVMEVAKGKICVIAHVACNSTRDSKILAAHAESLGVDAIAAIPPIYFRLPDKAVAKYWSDISDAAPNTDFFIYNIPQLAGTMLNPTLLKEMCKNPRVVGVKNSSPSAQDIATWRRENIVVLNGPDEQLLAGLAMGACGGIGGTYAVMPELFLKIITAFEEKDIALATEIQDEVYKIIELLCASSASMYAVAKGVLRLQGIDIGSVREPFLPLSDDDTALVKTCYERIEKAIEKFCK